MNFYKTHDPFNSKKVFLFFSRLSTPTSRPMWFKTKARNYLVSYVVQEYNKELKKKKQEEAEDLLRRELEQMTLLQWVLYRLNAGRRRRD